MNYEKALRHLNQKHDLCVMPILINVWYAACMGLQAYDRLCNISVTPTGISPQCNICRAVVTTV